MSSATKQPAARRGAAVYAAATAITQLCALVRYTILARLIGPTELGLAVTLILTAQFFDSMTESGSDRFLIQDHDGDNPAAQRLVQMLAVLRGTFVALALVLVGPFLADFFGHPALGASLMAFALAPFIAGFIHLDLRRRQRGLDFRQEAVTNLSAELASLAITTAAAIMFRSHVAIIIGLITRSVVLVAVSHLTAERRYGIGYSAEHARRLMAFGVPLMLNGLLLFLGSQSDRMVVGRELGLAELGVYSSVLMLILYPTSSLNRFVGGMFLPLVAAEARGEREGVSERLGGVILMISALIVVGFAIVTPTAVVVLFGSSFAQTLGVIALIGVLQTTRFMRTGTITMSLGLGRSRIAAATNFTRLVAIPLGFAAAFIDRRLETILVGFIAGEFFALVLGTLMVNSTRQAPLFTDFDRIGLFVLVTGGVVAVALGLELQTPWLWAVGALGVAAFAVLSAVRERQVISEGLSAFRRISRRVLSRFGVFRP